MMKNEAYVTPFDAVNVTKKGNTTTYTSPLLGETYTEIRHRSGLSIYVCPKQMTTTYALFATRYGSIDNRFAQRGEEPENIPAGVAHFLEHKMFANADGSDSMEKFAALGADSNAYTSATQTAYLFSATEHFSDCLRELLGFVTHPYFTDENVEKERGIIAEEIRMCRDLPGERAFSDLMNSLYAFHEIRRDICGTEESIRQITPALLYRCHRLFYQLTNMALFVCGPVCVEEVLRVADEVLPQTPPEPITVIRSPRKEPCGVVRKQSERKMQVAKTLFVIGIKDNEIPADPEARARREMALNILDEVLFARAGEFYRNLYEAGVITSSYNYGYSVSPTFAFHTISGESDTPQVVLEAMKKQVEKAKREGLSPKDVQRVRRVLYADCVKGFDSTEEIAGNLLSSVFDDVGLFDDLRFLHDVTDAELAELLNTVFAEENIAMALVRPLETPAEQNAEEKEEKEEENKAI